MLEYLLLMCEGEIYMEDRQVGRKEGRKAGRKAGRQAGTDMSVRMQTWRERVNYLDTSKSLE
jgi:predicted transposase YdaD